MWHIILIGYVFVTLMFSIAQYPQGIARVLIYLVFWTVLPTLFSLWVVLIRRRNKRMKLEERAERGNRDKAACKRTKCVSAKLKPQAAAKLKPSVLQKIVWRDTKRFCLFQAASLARQLADIFPTRKAPLNTIWRRAVAAPF